VCARERPEADRVQDGGAVSRAAVARVDQVAVIDGGDRERVVAGDGERPAPPEPVLGHERQPDRDPHDSSERRRALGGQLKVRQARTDRRQASRKLLGERDRAVVEHRREHPRTRLSGA
jgi:hypothetical protein